VQSHPGIKIIVIMDPEHRSQFSKLEGRHPFYATLDLPVSEAAMKQVLEELAAP